MKKVGIVILIIVLIFIALGLSRVLMYSINNKESNWNWGWTSFINFVNGDAVRKEEYIQKDEKISIDGIDELELEFRSSNLNLIFTDDNQVRIVQYSSEELTGNQLFTYSKSNSRLKVLEGSRRVHFFFNFTQTAYDVYIPKQYEGSLNLKSVSGDILVEDNLKLKELDISSTSGNINMNHIESKKIKLETISGDISLGDITSKELSMKSVSGNVKTGKLMNNIKIKTTSGDMRLGAIEGEIDLSSISGKIVSEDFKITGDSKVKTTSGNVEIYLNEESNCEIRPKTLSGDIEVANGKYVMGENPYSKFVVETVSGNIELTK